MVFYRKIVRKMFPKLEQFWYFLFQTKRWTLSQTNDFFSILKLSKNRIYFLRKTFDSDMACLYTYIHSHTDIFNHPSSTIQKKTDSDSIFPFSFKLSLIEFRNNLNNNFNFYIAFLQFIRPLKTLNGKKNFYREKLWGKYLPWQCLLLFPSM